MRFFENLGRVTVSELRERSKAYSEYLESIRERLPVSAFEFANAAWHYDASDHRCPHDSWVESLTISEPARGERLQHRSIRISACLLGAFHDGRVLLDYVDVRMYSLEHSGARISHGDWLVDEIRLSENGLVLHEVLFSNDSHWLIEAKDILYEWRPKS